LVAGANESGYHYVNVNYDRDYKADIVADIALAEEGFECPNCQEPMRASRGVEVGNIFKLGTRYSASLGANYLDENGKEHPIVMGSYGIGSGRLLACVAEEHHDDKGLIWPISVAPFDVHLVALRGGTKEADGIYERLQRAGFEVLYDDREETPGVKFNDADLVGLPIRLTVSERSLKEGGAELKLRSETEKRSIRIDKVVDEISEIKKQLLAEINEKVVTIPFEE
jgi:prolyl-tRNA synthetase